MINPDQQLEKYKKHVAARLGEIILVFQKIVVGDLSAKIKPLKKEDEFTPLVATLNMAIDKLKDSDRENKRKGRRIEKTKIRLKTKIIESYQGKVAKKVEGLIPIFQKVAAGNFSSKIEIPRKKDEFAPLTVALNMVLEDLRFLEKQNRLKTKILERVKANLEVKVEAKTKKLKELTRNLRKKVKERTEELQKKIEDLESFQRIAINREIKMIELKKELASFKKESGVAQKAPQITENSEIKTSFNYASRRP